MQLSDLPLDLILKVLPIKENLLTLPDDIIFLCLNLLPQKKSFKILMRASRNYPHLPLRTAPLSPNLYDYLSQFVTKFGRKMYLNFGKSVGSTFYKKYIIFNYNAIEQQWDLSYFWFRAFLQIWTGDEQSRIYAWLPYFVYNDPFPPTHLRILEPLWIKPDPNFVSFKQHLIPHRFIFFNWEANSGVGFNYNVFKRIENITLIGRLKALSVHYFSPNTSFPDIDSLLSRMWEIKKIDLAFGKLDLNTVPRSLDARKKCFIQVKIDKRFFSTQHYDQSVWKVKMLDDCALLSCTKCKHNICLRRMAKITAVYVKRLYSSVVVDRKLNYP
ncbi:hypothetical protein I9W82_000771 [Candida metapsilosis]|uniref:F-box domain-containing protein n=1 Tax=Candida metapsilosis TaxID=273372 RepID=A0A8H7ZJX4_9ASCO|nr:hypothetical protein I9W82_000771 [Candida metapsilosis]